MLQLPSGKPIHVLGQGTWGMGDHHSKRKDEVAALRLGLDLGMGLIDTAEMYGEGGAEKVVGEAIDGRRDEVFIVTKFWNMGSAISTNAYRKSIRVAGR